MELFWQEFKRELKLSCTVHIRALVSVALVTIVYISIFGALFSQNLAKNVPVLVLNEDAGPAGRELVQALTEQEDIAVQGISQSENELARQQETHEFIGVIHIPQIFSRSIQTGTPVNVEVAVNNSNTILGGSVVRGANAAIGAFNVQKLAALRMSKGWDAVTASANAAKLTLSERPFGNATGGYVDFFLPVFILHSLQIALVFIVAPAMAFEKRRVTRARIVTAYLAGKLGAYAIWIVVILFGTVLLGATFYNMNLASHCLPGMLIIGTAFGITMTAFSLMVGCWLPDALKCLTSCLCYIMPSVVFSGALWPRTSMDTFSTVVSAIMPIGYAAEAFRDFANTGASAFFWPSLLAQLLWTAGFFYLARKGLKRFYRQKEAV